MPEDTRVLVIDSLGSHTANLTSFEFRDRFDLLVHSLAKRNITAMMDIVKMRNTRTSIQLITYEIISKGIRLTSPGELIEAL